MLILRASIPLCLYFLAWQLAFALEERCILMVSEPNIKNQKMVDYECECGGVVEKVRVTKRSPAAPFLESCAL